MPANTTPIFPLTVQTSAATIVNADGTGEKTLVTAGANGTRIDAVSITSTDTAAVTLTVLVHDGTTSYAVGEIAVPAGSGTNGSAPAIKGLSADGLPWLDASGSLFLKTGWSLRVAAKAAVTSAKTVTLVAFSGDY
jgi:hypothetical protein